jgi:hypothetical protein
VLYEPVVHEPRAVDAMTPRIARRPHAARAAKRRSPSASGGEAHSSTIPPSLEQADVDLATTEIQSSAQMKPGLLGLTSR